MKNKKSIIIIILAIFLFAIATANASEIKKFQHDKGLKVTDIVDEKTAKKLGLI